MAEHDKPRPVSGEIMAGRANASPGKGPADFEEAEFEPVLHVARDDAPRHPTTSRPAAQPAAPPVQGLDSLRGGASAAATSDRRGGLAFWSGGFVIAFAAFWVSGGHSMLISAPSAVPAPASRQPLAIENVVSRVEDRGGRLILFVEGDARNGGQSTLAVPPIEILVTDGDGAVTRHFLGTNGTALPPGQRFAFSSRFEAPSNGVRSVAVTFRERP